MSHGNHKPCPPTPPVATPQTVPAQRGLDQAEDNRDPWWWSCAWAAIATEASTGRTFTSHDLQQTYALIEPDHPARWGALFRAAASAGLIEKVTAVTSQRPTRAGGLCWAWRGVRR